MPNTHFKGPPERSPDVWRSHILIDDVAPRITESIHSILATAIYEYLENEVEPLTTLINEEVETAVRSYLGEEIEGHEPSNSQIDILTVENGEPTIRFIPSYPLDHLAATTPLYSALCELIAFEKEIGNYGIMKLRAVLQAAIDVVDGKLANPFPYDAGSGNVELLPRNDPPNPRGRNDDH
jgi:hypothetical protein